MAPIGVNLRDLTVLAGPNSAGKSTVVQPLLLIKQTIEKPFDPGGLAIDGPLVKFTSTDQFLSGSLRREGDDALKVVLTTDDHGSSADAIFHLKTLIHVAALRGNPERDYSITAIGNEFPGEFTRYVASIVHFWGRTERPKLKKLADHLKKLNLTGNIGTRRLDDTRIEIRVGRLPVRARGGADDTVSIADVGVGVSQILPVLVALLVANKDQIVCIEQPEIHLHPRAQIALAEVILEAADRGVRVIIETHSSLLLLAIQSLVSEGKLAPERVSLNWFTRDAGGQTHVSEAVLADNGSYGDWPEDFGSVEMKLQNRYLDAASRHRASERNVA